MNDTPPGIPILTSPGPLGRYDIVLSGTELSCGEVDYVSTNTRFTAHPLGWHRHPGHELIFMLRGASGYRFELGDELTLAGGHFLVTPPGMAHRGSKNVREPSTVCAIILDSRWGSRKHSVFTPQELAWMQSSFSTDTPQIRPMTPAMRQTARWMHENMVRQGRSSGEDHVFLANLRLQACSLILHAAHQISQEERCSSIRVVERAKSYLISRHAKPITIDQLTSHVHCGRTRLFQAFKQETGMTPVDWLQRYRVSKALELLQSTNRTLNDIAAAVGLTSAAYLCHIVKQYTGRTPGSHRRAAE